MKKSERKREQQHAQLRTCENQLGNVLAGVAELLHRLRKSIAARDCKSARLAFDQADLHFKAIRAQLKKAEALNKALKLPPGPLGDVLEGVEVRCGAGAPVKPQKPPVRKPAPKAKARRR